VEVVGMLRLLLDRREFLRIGGLTGLGLGLPRAGLAASAKGRPGFGKAKSVLIIFTPGGMSQFETWDPKPNAPEEVRGAFSSIQTAAPGVRFGEHMPKIAKFADRLTVVRSMSHDDSDHGSAAYLALTGVFHQRKSGNPPISPNDFPAMGAVLKRARPETKMPYTAVHINGPLIAPRLPAPGQYGGFLGRPFEPLVIGDLTKSGNVLADLDDQEDLPTLRLDSRRQLLQALDNPHDVKRGIGPERGQLTQKAFELLGSERLRKAFDIDQEPGKIQERYGRHYSGLGCLLARRLVEAGLPFVNVFFNHGIRGQDDYPDDTDQYGWDTHNDIFDALKTHLLPRFDASFSFLLEDLEQRGLLDTTLVVCMGEFGRAPLVAVEKKFAGSSPGRKHWPQCYSVVLAGAGIKRGATFGVSDRMGAYPQSNPVAPGDLAATIFAALGVDPAGHFLDGTDRPWAIATGTPIAGVYS